jgi:hypothetical protein
MDALYSASIPYHPYAPVLMFIMHGTGSNWGENLGRILSQWHLLSWAVAYLILLVAFSCLPFVMC